MNETGRNGRGEEELDAFIIAAMKIIAGGTILLWILAILTYRT